MSFFNEETLLAALKARMERITVAGGYNTDAGVVVLTQRAEPSPESDGELVVSIVLTGTDYTVRGIGAGRTVTASTTIEIGAFTYIEDPRSQVSTVGLLRDLTRAAFEPIADAISAEVDDLTPVSSDIYLAPPGKDYSVVVLKLVARWCDHNLEASP